MPRMGIVVCRAAALPFRASRKKRNFMFILCLQSEKMKRAMCNKFKTNGDEVFVGAIVLSLVHALKIN